MRPSLQRLGWAFLHTAHAYHYQLAEGLKLIRPPNTMLLAPVLAAVALRRYWNGSWVGAGFALTFPMLFVGATAGVLVRNQPRAGAPAAIGAAQAAGTLVGRGSC